MKEQLSALIDGEFDVDNATHLIATAKSDGEMRQAWNNYHLIGDAMRGEEAVAPLTNRIMAAIEDEPTILAPASVSTDVNKPSMHKTPVFWSVAASVAAVFFVGLMLLQDQSINSQDLTAVEMADNQTTEYLTAHQTHAPTSSSYYIQNASFAGQQ